MAFVIAFAGPTGAGKTTLIGALKAHYQTQIQVFHVSQDGFYKSDDLCERVGEFYNWDVPSALKMDDFEKELDRAREEANQVLAGSLVFVDGILLFSKLELHAKYHAVIELKIEESKHRERRFERDGWIRENPDYWHQVVMPAHAAYGHLPALENVKHAAIDAENTKEEVLKLATQHIDSWMANK